MRACRGNWGRAIARETLATLYLLAAFSPGLAASVPIIEWGEAGLRFPALRIQTPFELAGSVLLVGGAMVFSRFVRHRGRVVVVAMILALLTATLAPAALHPSRVESSGNSRLAIWPPLSRSPHTTAGDRLQSPAAALPLGTDAYGRDVAARTLHGLRASLLVASASLLLSLAIALVFGGAAALAGGFVDTIARMLVQAAACFPALVVVIAIQTLLAPSLPLLILLLALFGWTVPARLVRTEILVQKDRPPIEALRLLGLGAPRIFFFHLLRLVWPPVLAHAAFALGQFILVESALSFLGFGVPNSLPSLGDLLQQGRNHPERGWHLLLVPGVILFVLVRALSVVGDELRERVQTRGAA